MKIVPFEEFQIFRASVGPWYDASKEAPPERVEVLGELDDLSHEGVWYLSGKDESMPRTTYYMRDGSVFKRDTSQKEPKGWFTCKETPEGWDMREVKVICWTPIPDHEIDAENINLVKVLRRYFRQKGKTADAALEALNTVIGIYEEKEKIARC